MPYVMFPPPPPLVEIEDSEKEDLINQVRKLPKEILYAVAEGRFLQGIVIDTTSFSQNDTIIIDCRIDATSFSSLAVIGGSTDCTSFRTVYLGKTAEIDCTSMNVKKSLTKSQEDAIRSMIEAGFTLEDVRELENVLNKKSNIEIVKMVDEVKEEKKSALTEQDREALRIMELAMEEKRRAEKGVNEVQKRKNDYYAKWGHPFQQVSAYLSKFFGN